MTDLSPSQRAQVERVRALIAPVPDFPKPGILFRDITPLLASPEGFRDAISLLEALSGELKPTHIVGAESRGFLFGLPLAQALQVPFIPARKPGKLPRQVASQAYSLEYGEDALEVHAEDLPQGARVLFVDDLLATGGTAAACVKLIEGLGAEVVGCLFLIELEGLNGRAQLGSVTCLAPISY